MVEKNARDHLKRVVKDARYKASLPHSDDLARAKMRRVGKNRLVGEEMSDSEYEDFMKMRQAEIDEERKEIAEFKKMNANEYPAFLDRKIALSDEFRRKGDSFNALRTLLFLDECKYALDNLPKNVSKEKYAKVLANRLMRIAVKSYTDSEGHIRLSESFWIEKPVKFAVELEEKYNIDFNDRYIKDELFHMHGTGQVANDYYSSANKKKRRSLEGKVIAILGLGLGLLFLSPNITGNVIGNLGRGPGNLIGALLFGIGLIGSWFWMNNKNI